MKLCIFVLAHSFVFASQQPAEENAQFIEMNEAKDKFLDEQKKEKTERENYIQRSTCCNRSLARDCGKGIIIAALFGVVVYGANELFKLNRSGSPDSANISPVNATSIVQPQGVHFNALLRMQQRMLPQHNTASHINKNTRSDKRHYFVPLPNKKFSSSKKRG
jgi:hypothetical protein